MVKSWDIFDTLIARKCIHPNKVFEIVEKKSGVKGFAASRIKSGAGSHSIDEIYKKLITISEIDEETAARLKKMEIDEEFEQTIPIIENLRQVKSGDVLISDMYLPEEIIRRMLDKVGLFVPVEILITSGGKANGSVWKQFADQGIYLCHTGDNRNSDVKNPREFGFDSVYTDLSAPNEGEKAILAKDVPFGEYLREIRLRNPFTEEIKRHYWILSTANVGVLLYCVKYINQLQQKYHFDYLGFCGRDTYYMYHLYRRLFDDDAIKTDYLYYSRRLLLNSQDDVFKYFKYRMEGRKALLIDNCGTGKHLNKIRELSGLKFAILINFAIGRKSAVRIYRSEDFVPDGWIKLNDDCDDVDGVNFEMSGGVNVNGMASEVINRATHNSPISMKTLNFNSVTVPRVRFSNLDDTEESDVLLACLNEVMHSEIQPPAVDWNDREKALDLFTATRDYFNIYANKLYMRRNQDVGTRTNAMGNQIA